MSTAFILAVGQDDFHLDTRTAGYVVESVMSLTQALNQFLTADFDLVLLCHSIPLNLKERDRLTCAIRASGSPVPSSLLHLSPKNAHAALQMQSSKVILRHLFRVSGRLYVRQKQDVSQNRPQACIPGSNGR
jgi:hypothetical protein